jgi:hypothetical protein
MRDIIGKRPGAILAVAFTTAGCLVPMVEAENSRPSTSLDSRTIPHPDWVQISGQIDETSVGKSQSGEEYVRAIVRSTEGGRVLVDLGPPRSGSFEPRHNDFIHVRGKGIEHNGQVTIIANEVYGQGRVFRIERNEQAAAAIADESIAPTGQAFAPSPAAPGAK